MFSKGHVLVTGALGGLGTAIVQRLVQEGAQVIACDRRHDDSGAWLSQFSTEQRLRIAVHALDVTKDEQVDALRAELDAQDIHVAYLVNNAGAAGRDDPARMSSKMFDIVMRINLYGTFYCTRAFCAPMIAQGFGRIVNLASLYAYHPGPGEAPYAAAKAGIVGYTHAIARDLGEHGVNVNVIAPGLIWHERLTGILPEDEYTDMIKSTSLKRAGKPGEIAGAVAFLLSDDSSFITGQTLHVNGGAYMTG